MKQRMLLISDLDGTLLDQDKRVPVRVVQALDAFVAQGGLFTVATGRTEDTCRLATDWLPINLPVILYNGAAVMELSTGEVLYERTLDAAAFKPFLRELMTAFPDVCVEIFAYGPVMLVSPRAVMDPYILKEQQLHRFVPLEETPCRWLKIMLSASNYRLQEVEAFINEKGDKLPPCDRFFSADYYYEIVDKGCSKGDGARFLAKRLDVAPEYVAAAGDHLNDENLLRWCGYPYAPANAHERIKAIATIMTATNSEGVLADVVADLQKQHRQSNVYDFNRKSLPLANCRRQG